MTDETARVARLMRVIDDMTKELDRQGIAEAMAELGFDPVALRLSSRPQTEMSSSFLAHVTDPHPVGPSR
jgi:hypothetical protein